MTSEKENSLGEFLRHEREQRGIAIEQVASATKVGVRTLHALEADHYVELPAKPFIRGFVTSYCRFIGLDSKEVLGRFESYINSKATERPNRESGHSGYVFEKRDGEQQSRTVLLIAIVGFILVGAIAVLFLKPSLRHHRSSHIEKLRAAHGTFDSHSVSPPPLPSSLPSPMEGSLALNGGPPANPASLTVVPLKSAGVIFPLSSSSPSPSEKLAKSLKKGAGANLADPLDSGLELKSKEIHHKLIFKVLADIWVRYQVDNRPVRKFIVRKGKTLILRGAERVKIQVSNVNSLTLNYNSQGVHPLSSDERVKINLGNALLSFPRELSQTEENAFVNESPLPETADPIPE